MIVTGDIAVPSAFYSELLDTNLSRHENVFKGKDILCNLEGIITDQLNLKCNTPVLYNHCSVVDVFKEHNIKILAAANNHSLDRPEYWPDTKNAIANSAISILGMGATPEEASEPTITEVEGKKLIVFNASWHVMMHHQKNPDKGVYVNIIKPAKILEDVSACKGKFPDSVILIYFHWNYDLETLPFPSHRKLAKALIDAGAKLVVGTHSHCVQGGERYEDGYIYYGLGNFFVPWYTFINGHISFPEFAKEEVVLEYDIQSDKALIHRFQYEPGDNEHTLELNDTVEFDQHINTHPRCSYAGMSEKDYLKYFRKNRRKKTLVPVYKDFNTPLRNAVKDYLLIRRMRALRFLAGMKFRSWNN